MHFYPQQTDKGWLLYVWLLACLVAVSTIPPLHDMIYWTWLRNVLPPRGAFEYSILLAYCCVYRRRDVDGIAGTAARQLVCAARLIVVCFALIFVIVEWLRRGGMIHFTSPPSMAVMCWRSYTHRRIVVVDMPMPPMPSRTRTEDGTTRMVDCCMH